MSTAQQQFVRAFEMTLGATHPPLRMVISPGDGENLTGASVALKVINPDGSALFTGNCTIDSETEAHYEWVGSEFTVSNTYWAQAQVDLATGKRVFVPFNEWFPIRVIDPVSP